jgi:hypothetical protein
MSPNKILKWRKIVYAIVVIFTLLFLYINLPFFYKLDAPEPFSFFSDENSAYLIKYNICLLDSIGDSTSESVNFMFGCGSPQLKKDVEESSEKVVIIHYGKCRHVSDFDSYLLNNNKSDYLILFPFDIEDIERTCKKKIDAKNNIATEIKLTDTPASHFDKANNSLIVEWQDSPSIEDFRFYSEHIFKDISFDKKSFNYYINDQLRYQNLIGNSPDSFMIKLKIPKYYIIENLEEYELSKPHSEEDIEKYYLIETDLKKNNMFHLIIIHNERNMIKRLINWIWGIFIVGILIDLLLQKIPKSEDSKNTQQNQKKSGTKKL